MYLSVSLSLSCSLSRVVGIVCKLLVRVHTIKRGSLKTEKDSLGTLHTVEYDPFIKSQIASRN